MTARSSPSLAASVTAGPPSGPAPRARGSRCATDRTRSGCRAGTEKSARRRPIRHRPCACRRPRRISSISWQSSSEILVLGRPSADTIAGMRVLYHLTLSPFARKVRVVLAEKNLDFTLKLEKIWERRPEFLALNPAGEVPVLIESDGTVLAGTEAIVEYLDEAYRE